MASVALAASHSGEMRSPSVLLPVMRLTARLSSLSLLARCPSLPASLSAVCQSSAFRLFFLSSLYSLAQRQTQRRRLPLHLVLVEPSAHQAGELLISR